MFADNVFKISNKLWDDAPEDNKREGFIKLFNDFNEKLKGTKFENNLKFSETGLNFFSVRCNPIGRANDVERNNDALILITPTDMYTFWETADPKTKRDGIAWALKYQWRANIRAHHWEKGRWAACQDNCKLWVGRFFGKVFKHFYGLFTIHVHNPGIYYNSGLGCQILNSDESYWKYMHPELDRQRKIDPNDVTVTLMQYEDFIELTKLAA